MAFDWQEFLTSRGIEHTDTGPSTARGNLYVHCPYCGAADRGMHMGVSLHGRGWGCWKETRHRGRNPTKLVQALLRCSWAEAERITGAKHTAPTQEGFAARIRSAMGQKEAEPEPEGVEFPKEFRKLSAELPHYRYMIRERKFTADEVERLIRKFHLKACMFGSWRWSWRIIIPVYDFQGELMTWSGRAVGEASLRYQTHSTDPEKCDEGHTPARKSITDCFLNAKQVARGGRFLVLSEGPFDCMRLWLHSQEFGAVPTCFFGKAISRSQIDLLAQVRNSYDEIFLLLDEDARLSSLRMSSDLRALKVKHFPLQNKKDPGEMKRSEVTDLLRQMAHQVGETRT